MLGDYPKERIAVICYGSVMQFAGCSFSWMRYYAFFIGKLTYPDIDRDLLKRAMIKSAFNPILHLLAVLLAFVSTKLAITLYVTLVGGHYSLLFFGELYSNFGDIVKSCVRGIGA